MESGAIISSKPISEVILSRIESEYVARVTHYLEGLGCRVTFRGMQGGYHIQFPAGTVEEVYAGQSTQWTRRTTILFLAGQTLTKYILTPFNPSHPYHVMLAFPHEVLDGPELPLRTET